MNKISINVTITKNQNQTYTWSYQSVYAGLNAQSGQITLQEPGETSITYNLQGNSYSLLYANLDPNVCATREIRSLSVDPNANSITLVDANSNGHTGATPFGINLVARVAGNLGAPIVSPDPQVENDPSAKSP